MTIEDQAEEIQFWVGNLLYGAYLVAEASVVLAGIAVDTLARNVAGRGL